MEVGTRDGEVITFGCSNFEVPMGCTSGDLQYKYSALTLTCIKRSENLKWEIPKKEEENSRSKQFVSLNRVPF